MIKAKKGNIKLKGTMHELLNEFGIITHALYNAMPAEDFADDERKKEVLRGVFEFAMMTDVEQQHELEKKAKAALSHLSELLGSIVKDKDEEKSEESEEKEDAE